VRKYLTVFSVGLQSTFVYRWNFFIRSLFQILPLLGTIFIWRAIFEAKGSGIGSFDYSQVTFYFLLVFVVNNLITPTDDEWQVAADIRDGQMNGFLVRPVNYLMYRFSLYTSSRILYSVASLPVLLLLFLMFLPYHHWPGDPVTWCLTFASLLLAAFLQFFIVFCVALLAFWLLEISTIVFILYSFEYFLSGHMFPLSFMPPLVQELLKWSPFPYELYFPIAIFMGKLHGSDLVFGFAAQIFWVMAGLYFATFVWRRGLRQYQAVGG
jgi:ABC-2 type transport system permease protein